MLKILRLLALLGNVIFILWITYNGIDEGFRGNLVQKASYISLMALLAINFFLLQRK
ncbi:MAG: hypothetical protein P4L62_04225 [Candidatus Pacebacteria bacterium]|nr:hypothetical protein [Candidatus Paceibacterota bacterium]